MATIGSAKATLVNKIDTLTASATAKDTIYLAKALKENTTHHSFTYQGAWAATTDYALDDVVTNGGNTYICKAAHTSGASFATGSNWDMMAEAGTTIGTGTAGQVLKTNSAGNGIEWGADEGGKILQVVNRSGNTAIANNNGPSSPFITDAHHSITPVAANSTILVIYSLSLMKGADCQALTYLYRQVAAGTDTQIRSLGYTLDNQGGWESGGSHGTYHDSPTYSLGNAVTYRVYAAVSNSSITLYTNTGGAGGASVTLIEIGA